MTKTVVVGVMGVLLLALLAAMPVQAQPIEAQAIAAARASTFLQAGNTTYQRSRLRTWVGIGLMTAGFNLAFFGKECGTAGALGPGYMQTGAFGSVSISATGLQPVAGAECAMGSRSRHESTWRAGDVLERAGAACQTLPARLDLPVGTRRSSGVGQCGRRFRPRIGDGFGVLAARAYGRRLGDGWCRASAHDRFCQRAGRGDKAGPVGHRDREPARLVAAGAPAGQQALRSC